MILKRRHLWAHCDKHHPCCDEGARLNKEIIRHKEGEDGKDTWPRVCCDEVEFFVTNTKTPSSQRSEEMWSSDS